MAPRFTQTMTANSSNSTLGAIYTGESNTFRTYSNGTADNLLSGTIAIGNRPPANTYTLTSALNQ